MKRGVWILLVLSLALNIGFVSAALVHWTDVHRGGRFAGPGFGPGAEGRGSGWTAGHPGRGRREGPGGGMGRRGSRMEGPRPGLFDVWPDRRIEELDRAVGLSPEQRGLLHERLGELRGAMQANAAALRAERLRLRRAMVEGDPEAALVRDGARRVAEVQARLDSLVAEAIIRENMILNPEQRERYRDLEWGPLEEAGPPPAAP